MSNFFKAIALLVAIACGVWIAVLWRWQATARDMNTQDIAVYLVLLPLVVFGFALALRWAWRGAVAKQANAQTAAAGGLATAQAALPADDARRHATAQLLGAHLVCAAGSSPGELLSAAKDSAPRPALDPELRDDEGLAVLTARIADLRPAELSPMFEPHLVATRAKRPDWADAEVPEHVQRALAALQEPLRNAVQTLLPWAARFERAVGAPPNLPLPRLVRVLLGWPTEWAAFEQAFASAVAATCIAESADASMPAECFAVTAHAGSGEELLLHADRLMQALARDGRDEPLIVAACHSTIGEAAVEALECAGVLFASQRRPKGRMPGEAAAALVLAGADWPAAPDAEGPVRHLHRPAVSRRDKSIDASGRVGSEMALQSMAQALAAGGVGVEAIAAVACDADQHTARGAEFHVGGLTLLPHLDSTEDMRLIGTVTGAVGAVSALMVVACAAELAKTLEKPCLAATFGDAFARLALVALPGPPASGAVAGGEPKAPTVKAAAA